MGACLYLKNRSFRFQLGGEICNYQFCRILSECFAQICSDFISIQFNLILIYSNLSRSWSTVCVTYSVTSGGQVKEEESRGVFENFDTARDLCQ